MIGSAIREMAAVQNSPLVCTAFVEKIVQVWNLSTQQKISEFEARFYSGARNLAVHPDGESVITGISRTTGWLCSYKLFSGELVWQKNRLKYPSYLRFGSSGEYLFCTLDNRRLERVDARTGDTIDVVRKTRHIFEGPGGYILIIPSVGSDYLLRKEYEVRIPKLTFAVLDVAFGSDRLCITESGGPVRCISYLTGTEHWRYTPPDGSHVLTLHYNGSDGFFYGILRDYEKGEFRYLVRFDPETGQTSRLCSLKSWEETFSAATQQLVTSSGEIIDLLNGKVVAELDFPRIEYPDSLR